MVSPISRFNLVAFFGVKFDLLVFSRREVQFICIV